MQWTCHDLTQRGGVRKALVCCQLELEVHLNVLRACRACPRNGAVEMVYRTGFTAAFSGRTNTATHANTFNRSHTKNEEILYANLV
jgi:hypothetical protein